MINKDRILKVDIYTGEGEHLFSTRAFNFPRDFFKIKGWELVSIKTQGLPILHKDSKISAVFEYINGTRIKCDTKVDISTDSQLNFHVDEGYILEERRGSYKVNTPNSKAYIKRIERTSGEVIDLEDKFEVSVININLTGIFMDCEIELEPSDIITLDILDNPIELRTEILRAQRNTDGVMLGYGCRFLDVTPSQEEKIARFIFDCQLAERDKQRKS